MWGFVRRCVSVLVCYMVHLASVKLTYPEFLAFQQPSYLTDPMGMWKLWYSDSIPTKFPGRGRWEEDEKSRKIHTCGSSPCWKRWVDSPVPVQQPFIPLLLFAAMPHLTLVLSWVPRLFRKIRFSSKHTSELAWLCLSTYTSLLTAHQLVVRVGCPSVPRSRCFEMLRLVTFYSTLGSLLLSPISFPHCQCSLMPLP